MAHSHAHHLPTEPETPRRGLAAVLTAVVLVIAAGAVAAMIHLWPAADEVPHDRNPLAGDGVTRVDGTVSRVDPFDCGSGGLGPDMMPTVDGACAHVRADTDEGAATFDLDSARYRAGIEVGDRVTMLRIAPDGQQPTYEFVDFRRGLPLTALAAIFCVLVVAVARWRGLFAIVGIGITLLALTQYVLPSLLAGRSPLATAIVGSTVIMIAVLYLAHGVSIRTTSALFGTLFGIAATAAMGVLATGWTSLSGIGSEDDQVLIATVPNLDLSAIAAATMVIAGLGVLNDVTVTQASAVWELRSLRPEANRRSLFASAMRIGRDHIASSVYTLVFAYAGSAMVVLLLVTAYQQRLIDVASTEQVGTEVVRTLVGAIGLVLAVPVTTAIAVWLAPGERADTDPPSRPQQVGSHARRPEHEGGRPEA